VLNPVNIVNVMSLLKLRKNEKVDNIVLKFVLVSKISDFDMVNTALFFSHNSFNVQSQSVLYVFRTFQKL